MPVASAVTDRWHVPQFSKIYDERVRQTRVAMLISSPEPLYDKDGPSVERLAVLAKEIDRFAKSKWASTEAKGAVDFFGMEAIESFVAILEFASSGAYATPTQRLKAYYEFDGEKIGALVPRGGQIDDNPRDYCVTV
ncbi:hypothetical protein [Celeribacter neptunius]|nr:hypothetical protein [Celeribacter neptunius]